MEKAAQYLTVKEAAASLGVSQQAIWNAIGEKRLPAVVKYSKKLIALRDLEAYKARSQSGGAPPKGRPRVRLPGPAVEPS